MAGMLPGVECARRRRFRQGGSIDPPSGYRRSSFCLYATSHETHLGANSMGKLQQRSASSKESHGGTLGGIAREAKERLDERLRSQRSLEIERHNSMGGARPVTGGAGGRGSGPAILSSIQREVFYLKKGSRKFSWSRLGWKAAKQADECAVCLEEFRAGDILVHTPCAHRFHWSCVVPWLESSSHCPCCRMTIL